MPIVEQCKGCDHVLTTEECKVLKMPEKQWSRLGGCAHRTHNKGEQIENRSRIQASAFIDPLKASKQKSRGTSGKADLRVDGIKRKKKKMERRDLR